MLRLNNCPLFSVLSPVELRKCESLFRVVNFPWQSVIFQENSHGAAMYFINEGKVKIFKNDKGNREIILAELHEGDFFGEMSLLDDKPRSASAVALTDTVLSQLTKEDFISLLRQNPIISLKLLQTLSRRLRTANEMIESISYREVREKMISYLSAQQEKEFTPQQLSDLLGISAEEVNKLLLALQEEGLLDIKQFKIIWLGHKK